MENTNESFLNVIFEKLDEIKGGFTKRDVLMKFISNMTSNPVELLATDKVEGVFITYEEFSDGDISLFISRSHHVNERDEYYIRINRKNYQNECYMVRKKLEKKD